MLMNNLFLQEAVSEVFNPAPIVADFKKALNSCNLTKFRSTDACALFYSGFFMNQVQTEMTVLQWSQVYNALLNDDKFVTQLCLYIALYHPREYTGMFQPLVNLMDAELAELNTNKLRYLSDVKAFFQFLQNRFDSIGVTVRAQTNDQDAAKFLTIINGTLSSKIFYINNLIQRTIDASYDQDAITHEYYDAPLEEDAKELLSLFEHAEDHILKLMETTSLNEGIVNKAKEAAKVAHVKRKKAERSFDELVMKKYKEYVRNRQNRKHAEMVGEALRVNHELKKILYTLPLSLINPAWTVIAWVIATVVDRATDKKDRNLLVGQLKDELEIVEEKIQMAERNGDDKAKVELIRLRQKLQREYERIQRMPFDGARMQRQRN